MHKSRLILQKTHVLDWTCSYTVCTRTVHHNYVQEQCCTKVKYKNNVAPTSLNAGSDVEFFMYRTLISMSLFLCLSPFASGSAHATFDVWTIYRPNRINLQHVICSRLIQLGATQTQRARDSNVDILVIFFTPMEIFWFKTNELSTIFLN
jgi:hypothetical protein